MSNELARAILAMKAEGASIVYGEATAVNTVALEGAATPAELPALSPVAAGQYVAVLQQGADRLILGAMATPWTAVTFQNSWANYGGFGPVKYRRVGDVVDLRGLCLHPSAGSGLTICTLPAGFRPASHVIHSAQAYTTVDSYCTARLDVTAGGAVTVSATGLSGQFQYISLDCLQFSVSP